MKNLSKLSLAIIIPAYNEAKIIRDVIKKTRAIFNKSSFNCKLIVVDDGSRDNTASLAKQGGAYVISHILNVGSGGATATGLSYAQINQFDIAATMDADGQHDPRDVLKGVRIMAEGGSDLLIGSRLLNAKGMSKIKFWGNKGLGLITSILFGINVTDSQSGLRIFSKKALENLKWKTSGYEYCSEMLWRAKQQGLVIKEYPIRAIYTDYSLSKGQSNWNAFNILKSLLKRRVMEVFGE